MPLSNLRTITLTGAVDLSDVESRLTTLEAENIEQFTAISALQAQSLQTESVSASTPSLPDQSSVDLSVELGKTFLLVKVEATARCRIRLYRSAAFRAADNTRAFGVLPTGEHGLILDLLIPSSNLQWDLAPIALGSNADNPRTSTIYAAVQNLSGSQQSITLTFSCIILEA